MTNHTPSPWQWLEDDWWGGYSGLYGPDDEAVLIPDHCNDGDDGAAWFEEYPSEADRLLMQASPDMLEALEMNLRWHEGGLRNGPFNPAGPGAIRLIEATEAAIKLAKEGRNAHEST